MKKNILALLLLATMFSACGKGEGPTTQTVPNAFKITDLEYTINNYYNVYWDINCLIYAQYTNNTSSKVTISGQIKFWLSSTAYDPYPLMHVYELPAGPNVSGQWKSERETISRWTPLESGTYTIEAEVTANFSNGPITSTLVKRITISD
jgi:hypothetical protein